MNHTLDALARPSGTFAMVAMDQRESLRTMLEAAGAPQRPADLARFKSAVADVLAPAASAFLIDVDYALAEVRHKVATVPGCGLIVAADALEQERGGPVEETRLDARVVDGSTDLGGAAALKLLIIWRRDALRAERVQLARAFVERTRELGLVSVLEPVVRATPAELADGTWDTEVAIREAAAELSAVGPDLYKVQVPLQGRAAADELVVACRLLDEAISTPWVVLSQGVSIDDFPGAVRAAALAGASGFLAGRALWSDLVGSADLEGDLRSIALPRLEALGALVDEHARPWHAR